MPSHDRSAPGREPSSARPVSLLPADVLACAALTTPLLRDALRLARWSAPATPLTPEGLPYATDIRAADEALGLWSHGLDAEAASEGPDWVDAEAVEAARFALPWRTAVRLGLLEATADWAGPEPGLEERVRDPDQVLRWWTGVFEASVGRARDDLSAGTPWPGVDEPCLVTAVLRFLYEAPDGFRVPLPVLVGAVLREPAEGPGPDLPLPSRDRRRATGRVVRTLRQLLGTGAVALVTAEDAGPDGAAPRCAGYGHPAVELTPLGRYGVRGFLEEEGVEAPLVGSLAGAGAAGFLDALGTLPPERLIAEVRPWLDERTPAAALRQIVAVTDGPGRALRRWTGTKVLDATSSEIGPELRALLSSDRPSVVSLAAVVLLTSGMLSPEEVDGVMAGHGHWVVIDMIAAAAERSPEDLPGFLSADGVPDIEQLVLDDTDRLWSPEHPDTLPVLDAVGRHHPDASTAARAREAVRARAVAQLRKRPGLSPPHRNPFRPWSRGAADPGYGGGAAEAPDAGRDDGRERFRVRNWFRRRPRNPWRVRGRHRAQDRDRP
ncbi:hypothetical protein [Nocardiopsis tropica]|uniref:Uncharacterized protein n=1 Tax=Nocardiopsis tropica TaxID=109330 RepID=A0ABU7KI26_9ACTN|nr:hypothetical protein [Nocardiopsis umidischolae]MEE2048948.1 hypothetical protein [Nocardiopsis umidischolae]